MKYKLSAKGATFLKGRELGPDGKVALKAYKCPAGKWTIGWGHTGPEVTATSTCTLEQAEAYFAADVAKWEALVNSAITGPYAQPLKDYQFDMLVSLAHNIGDSFRTSTLAAGLKNGLSPTKLAGQFERWVYGHVDGKLVVINGLVNRRKQERQIFIGGY